MTERIKSAIHCMRTSQDIEVCEECPIYGEVGTDHCFEDSCRIAEKSLSAWEEVLHELEEMKCEYDCTANEFQRGANAGANFIRNKAIDIINQKLEGVKE